MKFDLSNKTERERAFSRFAFYSEKGKRIELKEWKAKRTNSQNRYLHVCLGFIAQETGYTLEEAKSVLKRQFGKFMVYEKNGEKFLNSTSHLDTNEITEFIDFIRHTASENLGVYIPTPEQYYEDEFEIEKQLQGIL